MHINVNCTICQEIGICKHRQLINCILVVFNDAKNVPIHTITAAQQQLVLQQSISGYVAYPVVSYTKQFKILAFPWN